MKVAELNALPPGTALLFKSGQDRSIEVTLLHVGWSMRRGRQVREATVTSRGIGNFGAIAGELRSAKRS